MAVINKYHKCTLCLFVHSDVIPLCNQENWEPLLVIDKECYSWRFVCEKKSTRKQLCHVWDHSNEFFHVWMNWHGELQECCSSCEAAAGKLAAHWRHSREIRGGSASSWRHAVLRTLIGRSADNFRHAFWSARGRATDKRALTGIKCKTNRIESVRFCTLQCASLLYSQRNKETYLLATAMCFVRRQQ